MGVLKIEIAKTVKEDEVATSTLQRFLAESEKIMPPPEGSAEENLFHYRRDAWQAYEAGLLKRVLDLEQTEEGEMLPREKYFYVS